MNLPQGGPAFPTEDDKNYFHGMVLRDWFAGMAISGMSSWRSFKEVESIEQAVQQAYSIADAMLVERDKTSP